MKTLRSFLFQGTTLLLSAVSMMSGQTVEQRITTILSQMTLAEKIKQLHADDAYLRKVVDLGAEKARTSARKTIREVREIIGFKSF